MGKFKEVSDVLHKEIDRAFVWWQIVSWALLLGGFIMQVFSYSVSDNPPFIMEFGGLICVLVSVFNFVVSLLIGVLFAMKSFENKNKEILLKRVLVIVGYLVAAIIIFALSLNSGYLI